MNDENLDAVTKPDEDEPILFKVWWWWKVTWTVIRNLLYVWLVFLAFEKASSALDNVVLCLLVLVLQSVNWAHTTQLRVAVEEGFATRRILFIVLKAAGEDMEEATEMLNGAEKKYLKSNPIYYINLVAASLVYLILVWKLVATLIF
jgi:hypothetical protein